MITETISVQPSTTNTRRHNLEG